MGSVILESYERFKGENFEFNPFENFVIRMFEKRNKFKKEKKNLIQTIIKKQKNAVCGFCIRDEVNEFYTFCLLNGWELNMVTELMNGFLLRTGISW